MKEFRFLGLKIFAYGETKKTPKVNQPINVKTLPAGRVSVPSEGEVMFFEEKDVVILRPKFLMEVIPYIRELAYGNPNISQALNNIVELGNTGHEIQFDAAVKPDQINKMRAHLEAKKKYWSESVGGMDGLVNKMISQVMIAGALSNEWVPNISLTGLQSVVMVNPELIRWGYNKATQKYEPYQYIAGIFNTLLIPDGSATNLQKLNPNTYKYYALNGDTDNPYGIPPYIPALPGIKTQKLMLDNMNFIIEQIGVLGFLQVLVDKPDRIGAESEKNYETRLNTFLDNVKKKVQDGYRDGIAVGYKDDAAFEFNSTTKDVNGVADLFQLNELQVMSGLKQDSSMLGRNYGTSESQITVIFTKLIAQLKNVQSLVKCNLEYGYALELRLAGYQFNSLTVNFNPSTAMDELKIQQAEEIKIRNSNALHQDGQISQDQYAHRHGLEKADKPEPRVIRGNVQSQAEIDAKAQALDNAAGKKKTKKKQPAEKSLK